MKSKLLFITFILLLLSILHSCGSSRKAQIVDKVVKAEIVSHTADTTAVVKHHLMAVADMSLEDVEVTHIVYDTNIRSPSDQQKIISKTTYKKAKRNNIQKSGVCDSAYISMSKNRKAKVVVDSIRSEKVTEKKETTVPKQMGGLVKWVCILIGLIIVWYIMKSFGRK